MSSTVRHVGLKDPLVAFPVLERRSLAVNTANRQIAVGDEAPGGATGLPLSLIGIRFFATTAQYLADDMVVHLGQIWKARFTIAPGSPFSPSDWVGMSDGGQFVLLDGSREMYGNLEIDKPGASLVLNATGPSQADIWFRRDGLTRWLLRSDELAAVDFHIYRFNDAGFVIDAPLTISRSTGRLSVLTNPTLPLELTPKQYVDAQIATVATNANDRVLRAGDTMTGGLTVPVLTIRNAGYSDLYFAEGDGNARWLIRGNDPTTANLEFHRYNGSGGYLGAALVLDNATGDATFSGVVKTSPGLQFGGNAPTGFYGDGTNVVIRTYGANGIYLQSANGGQNYGVFHAGGLDVYGVITSTAQDGLRVTVPAGYFARTLYTVSGVRQWSAGVYADGRYAIGDESAGAARLIIDLAGKVWFANDADIPGTLTVGTVNVGTVNSNTINNSGGLTTGSLHVTGNSQLDGNLVVNGTITSSGGIGGTPIPMSASGYQTRRGTPGPFLTDPVNAPWNYSGPKHFNIADNPPTSAYWSLWVDHICAGSFAWMGTLHANIDQADVWEGVKAAQLVDYEDPAQRDDVERTPLMSDKTIAALMKALQRAMERIETLELKVKELSHARSG